MKILLTGANGQVGYEIIAACKALPITLIACNRQDLDITNQHSITDTIGHHAPDFVINAAAYTAVDRAEKEPELAFAVNAKAPEYLAKTCKKYRIPLLHLSTDYVFDGRSNKPYCENDMANPLGVYGHSKWLGEKAIRDHWDKHIILRVSWVFGRHGHNFVKTMLRLMQEQEELRIVADQHGCPTYAGDIANAILNVISKPIWGTFHYCGTPATTWHGFAAAILEKARNAQPIVSKKLIAILTKDYPMPAERPVNSVLDCAKFTKTFTLAPNDWNKGLNAVLSAHL
jgi:dTDP-4-dehydrorhamnose reductase